MFPFLQIFGFDFGDIGAYLDGLLTDLISFLVGVLQYIWAVLVTVVNYLFAVLQFVWNFLTTIFQDIVKVLKWVWNNVIKAALVKALQLFVTVRNWLAKIFGPILHYLRLARQWMDWAFNKFVRPILVIIQNLRKFLLLFRLLGFKWATKLDNILAKVQADILKAYEILRQNLNKVISFVQLIADPTGLLRRNPLFGSLIRSQNELRNLMLNAPFNPLSPGQVQSQQNAAAQATAAQQKQNYQQYYSQGQVTPDDEQARKDFAAAFDQTYNG